HSKEFYCFDAQTGKLVWGVNLDDDGPTSAVVEDDIVVFNTESCTIFALDANTGKQLWSWWLGDPLTSTPTIARGKVFTSYPAAGGGGQGKGRVPAPKGKVPPCSHVLAALDLKSGKILWQRWLDSDVMSASVAVDKDVYCTSFGGVVYKFAQKDGAVLSAVRTRATSAPVVVGDEVFLTRRTDNGKDGPQEGAIAWDPAKGGQRATGQAKAAVYLDEKVQRGSEHAG